MTELSYLPFDIDVYQEYTPAPKKKRVSIKPQEEICFKVSRLRDNLFVANNTDLVLKLEDQSCYCVGLYERRSKKIIPLTPEKRRFCEKFEIKILET